MPPRLRKNVNVLIICDLKYKHTFLIFWYFFFLKDTELLLVISHGTFAMFLLKPFYNRQPCSILITLWSLGKYVILLDIISGAKLTCCRIFFSE